MNLVSKVLVYTETMTSVAFRTTRAALENFLKKAVQIIQKTPVQY